MDNMLVIHEYMHGVTSRLTGGRKNAHCLADFESSGLSEGWSDAVAAMFTRKSISDMGDVAFGAWASRNKLRGLRRYPYSTNVTKNPLLYSDIKSSKNSHELGEIWASMLNEVYVNMVERYGFASNWTDRSRTAGNIVTMKVIFKGLMLQPCNPTFLSARDAIIRADKVDYDGMYKCQIWSGFAKRGIVNLIQDWVIRQIDVTQTAMICRQNANSVVCIYSNHRYKLRNSR